MFRRTNKLNFTMDASKTNPIKRERAIFPREISLHMVPVNQILLLVRNGIWEGGEPCRYEEK